MRSSQRCRSLESGGSLHIAAEKVEVNVGATKAKNPTGFVGQSHPIPLIKR